MGDAELDKLITQLRAMAEDENDIRWEAADLLEELQEEMKRLTQLHEAAVKTDKSGETNDIK